LKCLLGEAALGFGPQGKDTMFEQKTVAARRVVPALLVTTLLTLGGCAVGPKYERPVVETPAEWKNRIAAEVDGSTAPVPQTAGAEVVTLRTDWWQLFNDEKLNEMAAKALDANQDIQLAVGRVDEARALARLSKADFFPAISLDPSYTRLKNSENSSPFGRGGSSGSTSGVAGGGGSTFSDPFNRFSLPITLSYELDVWGRIRRGRTAAKDRAQAAVADYQAVLLLVTSDVALNNFLLRALDSEREVLENNLKLRGESLDLVETRFKFGATDMLDVARARSDVASTKASIADIKRQREAVVNVLAILCGRPAPDFALEPRPLAMTPPAIPMGLPSELLLRRPDVASAERILAATSEDIGVAKAAFFPRISLTAGSGFESAELSDLLKGSSAVWTLAANLAQPLFTGGRNRAELEAAKARYQQALAQYKQQVLVAFKDVEDALVDIRSRAEQAVALDAAIAAAREVTQLARTRYEKGQVSYLDVVDAQRQQLVLEQQATQVLGQRLTSTVRLIKALGGGWTEAEIGAYQAREGVDWKKKPEEAKPIEADPAK
jgi:outer membrane protein, multidrug efflux system